MTGTRKTNKVNESGDPTPGEVVLNEILESGVLNNQDGGLEPAKSSGTNDKNLSDGEVLGVGVFH